MLNFENLDKAVYSGAGAYDIPELPPVTDVPATEAVCKAEWIPFNFAKSCNAPEGKGVHFFVDDYQFVRVWNSPDKYIPLLKRFAAVLAPDFSTYTDMPRAMQIYNHYRKHWVARYLTDSGITVIPTISWSTPDSYEWCFEGEPRNSVVAISTVGCMKRDARELFFMGFDEMKRRLCPTKIICYGAEIEASVTFKGCINIPPYYKKIKERCNGNN